jgi:stearoyl-CoA desaturase (delta-9 desaturase)
MMVKPRRKPGVADVSDLAKSDVVRWQHKHYLWLIAIMAFIVPTVIPWLGWGDAQGGYIYAGILRLCFVHHVCHLSPSTADPQLNISGH